MRVREDDACLAAGEGGHMPTPSPLRELGWPGEVAVGQAGAAAHEAAVQAVQAAFTELLLLQYCAQPYAAPEEEAELP